MNQAMKNYVRKQPAVSFYIFAFVIGAIGYTPWVERISLTGDETFDTSLFRNEGIEEVWRIIGEQSEWLLNTINAYKDNVSTPPLHIAEFLHYYSNMTQMRFG